MKQKKLVIFMPSIEVGGVEKNLIILANHLINKISDISIITISKKFRNKFNRKIKFITLHSNFWTSLGKRKKFLISLYLLTLQIIRNRKITVLCLQGNIYCTLLCKIFGIKIIVRSNTAPDGWSHNIYKFFCYKYILSLADKVIVNSLEFKKRFKTKFNIDAICIYNPLDKKEIIRKSKIRQNTKFHKEKLNLISVGRLVDQKDQITLLKAVNIIKNKVDFNLVIIGDGKEKNNLLNYIYSNKLHKKVQILSSKNDPLSMIKASDIFLLSSLYEGLPNVLLEAQVLKTYIISSNCPTGPKEILLNGKAGSLFKVGDYKSLANILINFSNNKRKNSKKIILGYKNLFRFDYKKNLKNYFNQINSLME
tara:strand:- start:435 stop:1532 length:1098 start_codon:yes stop_codon:yes gene_type:complete